MYCSLLRDQNSHSQNWGSSEDTRALKPRTTMFFFSFGNEMVVYINSDISIAKEKEIQIITTCISHFTSIRSHNK